MARLRPPWSGGDTHPAVVDRNSSGALAEGGGLVLVATLTPALALTLAPALTLVACVPQRSLGTRRPDGHES
jgi:hypothetical protein